MTIMDMCEHSYSKHSASPRKWRDDRKDPTDEHLCTKADAVTALDGLEARTE